MDELRQFFRLDEQAVLTMKRLQEEEVKAQIRAIRFEIEPEVDEHQPFAVIETELKRLIEKLRPKLPETTHVIEMLDCKLRYLMRYVPIPEEDKIASTKMNAARMVSLSAGGIACPLNEDEQMLAPNEMVAMDIVLLPLYYTIRTVAKLLRKEGNIASFEFSYMREDDKERLIQFLLKKQAENLRMDRSTAWLDAEGS